MKRSHLTLLVVAVVVGYFIWRRRETKRSVFATIKRPEQLPL